MPPGILNRFHRIIVAQTIAKRPPPAGAPASRGAHQPRRHGITGMEPVGRPSGPHLDNIFGRNPYFLTGALSSRGNAPESNVMWARPEGHLHKSGTTATQRPAGIAATGD